MTDDFAKGHFRECYHAQGPDEHPPRSIGNADLKVGPTDGNADLKAGPAKHYSSTRTALVGGTRALRVVPTFRSAENGSWSCLNRHAFTQFDSHVPVRNRCSNRYRTDTVKP